MYLLHFSLTFKPCPTCFGTLNGIEIVITDQPESSEVEPLTTIGYITIEVQSVNNAPVIFMLNKDGEIILHPDPTDAITVNVLIIHKCL